MSLRRKGPSPNKALSFETSGRARNAPGAPDWPVHESHPHDTSRNAAGS